MLKSLVILVIKRCIFLCLPPGAKICAFIGFGFYWEKGKREKGKGKEGREKGKREGERGKGKGEEGREKGKEKGRGKGKGERGKAKGGRAKDKRGEGKGEGKREKREGKRGKRNLTKKQYQKCFKKISGGLEVDLFRVPKRSIILLKSKNFLCKGGSAPLHPHAAANFFKVCGGFINL